MDHIPSPNAGARPSLNAPLLCNSVCVPRQTRFGDFPYQFATTVLPELERRSQPINDNLLNLVQSWLFFHVASKFFDREIDPSSFRGANASLGPVLCSLPLRQLRRDWIANQTLATPQEHRQTSLRCVELLAQALYACERLEEEKVDVKGLDLILISVRILLCTLAITTQAITRHPDVQHLIERLVLIPAQTDHTHLDHFPFLHHMVANGWCPHQIEFLLKTCCATTICYFAGMKRGIHPEHPNHQGCIRSDHCIIHKVHGEQESRSHVSEDCGCDPIMIDEDHMMDIIEQDGIPLIDCRTMLTDSSSIALVKHHPKMSYIAISHVWADGLGNPYSNAMSRCQLERLLSQIRAMKSPETRHEPIRLWIDTFCIPVVATQEANHPADQAEPHLHSQRNHDLKQKAIRMMTPIYAGADAVLALDSELQSTSPYDISFAELTARVHVCGWKGRAWTLQEGALAFKLGFQFSNGVLFTKEAQKMYNESIKVAMWNNNFDEHFQLLKDCRQSWFLPSVGRHRLDRVRNLRAREVQFMEVWNNLLGKSTTKPDDFFEIVANLLDFDASHIRKLGKMSDMMGAMIFRQHRIPLDIICLPSDHPEGPIPMHFRVPERPRDLVLTEESFKTYLSQYDRRQFSLDSTHGPTGYRVMIPQFPIQQFCIRPTSYVDSNDSHIEVLLATSLGDDVTYRKGVYLYFATLPSHGLLQDTKHCGACFVIEYDKKKSLSMRYACSLKFRLCRAGACRTARPNIIPAMLVRRDVMVLVDIGHELPLAGKRRPINMAKIRSGISKPKLYTYSIGPFILILLVYPLVVESNMILTLTLLYIPIFSLWATVFALYLWSASGGSYRACIDSYTGSSGGRLDPFDETFVRIFLTFKTLEDWIILVTRTVGTIIRTLRPSFRQKHRWNRSLEDMVYSEAKVDYRGRMLNIPRPKDYDFSFGGATNTIALRLDSQFNAFESLGNEGAEVLQRLVETLAEPP
ncbi:Het domain protein [Apiospora arundinis]